MPDVVPIGKVGSQGFAIVFIVVDQDYIGHVRAFPL